MKYLVNEMWNWRECGVFSPAEKMTILAQALQDSVKTITHTLKEIIQINSCV